MKKILLTTALLAGTTAFAALASNGVASGQIKAMHILSDIDNGYAPASGSGYLAKLKYVTPELIDNLKIGSAFYINGEASSVNWDDDIKDARGMYTAGRGETVAHLGEMYLEYGLEYIVPLAHIKLGRQILDTPLTKIKWSLMPNFYNAGVLSFTPYIKHMLLSLGHINHVSFGSRAFTDWGLIGEKKGGAGTEAAPVQAIFQNIGTASTGEETSGISFLNLKYQTPTLKIRAMIANSYDISINSYLDVLYRLKLSKSLGLTFGAQYLAQGKSGDAHAGDLSFDMSGLKIRLGSKKYSVFAAYNKSSDEGRFFNPYGTDPAYTSSLFSRNAYRQNVSAYKVGGHYVIVKGLKVKITHANYGQSETGVSKTDATETDIIIAYKPTKALTLKVFNAIRVSEYHTDATEKKMNHFRAVASYVF